VPKPRGFLARGRDFLLNRGESAAAKSEYTVHQGTGQGVHTPLFAAHMPRSFQPDFIEALREAIPIFDAMIDRLVTLDGVPLIEGDDTALVAEIQQWAKSVRVNDVQKGLTSFTHAMRNEVHEQGFSLPEFGYSPDGNDIVKLSVPDSKALHCSRQQDGRLSWFFNPLVVAPRYNGMQTVLESRQSPNVLSSYFSNMGFRPLNMSNKAYMAYTVENSNPYGVSRLRSMPFVAKALATLQNGIANTHERFGDPSYHIAYKAGGKVAPDELVKRQKDLAAGLSETIQAKRDGKSVEFATAVDKDSDVVIKVIGADGQVLDIETPARHLLEQVVGKSGLAAWMLGLHFSTSERLAKFQSEIVKQESDTRTSMEGELLEDLVERLLRARGRTWSNEVITLEDGRTVRKAWRIRYLKPNLSDMVAQAQAKFMNAQADAVLSNAGVDGKPVQNNTETKPEEDSATALAHHLLEQSFGEQYSMSSHIKADASHASAFLETHALETRPLDNPALDKIENDALKAINTQWQLCISRIIVALGLTASEKPNHGEATAGMTSLGFSFTTADKKMIADTMAEFVGELHVNEPLNQGALSQAYLRAWSQGVLDAYLRGNLDKPSGALSNALAVENMLKTSRKTFTTFVEDTITPEVERLLLAGIESGDNPLNIARNLRQSLDGAPWKWEQIARTEIALAWDDAKRGEWQAEIADSVIDDLFDFIPAPDGCPVCQAQAVGNPRILAATPKPVVNTHPSCRCDIAPHV